MGQKLQENVLVCQRAKINKEIGTVDEEREASREKSIRIGKNVG